MKNNNNRKSKNVSYFTTDHTVAQQSSEGENDDRRKRLDQLSRSPGKCPLAICDQIVFPTGFLVHCLHKHTRSGHTRVSEIFDEQPVRMRFDPRKFKLNEPHSLAILMYAGIEGKPKTLPGLRYISFPNAALMNERRRCEHHLPIMVMICKSTWYALLPDRELEQHLVVLNSANAAIYVLWLVSPVVSKKFYYTMTVYDRYYTHSRSVIRKIRNYTHSQNPSDFLSREQNFMVLRESEINDFFRSHDPTDDDTMATGIHMELIVHERPNIGQISQTKIKYLNESNDFDCQDKPHGNLNQLKLPRTKMSMARSIHGKLSLTRKPVAKASSSFIINQTYHLCDNSTEAVSNDKNFLK